MSIVDFVEEGKSNTHCRWSQHWRVPCCCRKCWTPWGRRERRTWRPRESVVIGWQRNILPLGFYWMTIDDVLHCSKQFVLFKLKYCAVHMMKARKCFLQYKSNNYAIMRQWSTNRSTVFAEFFLFYLQRVSPRKMHQKRFLSFSSYAPHELGMPQSSIFETFLGTPETKICNCFHNTG